jgi:hypothetical protein
MGAFARVAVPGYLVKPEGGEIRAISPPRSRTFGLGRLVGYVLLVGAIVLIVAAVKRAGRRTGEGVGSSK